MASLKFSNYQFRVLAILALINFVNFADRTVIFPLFPLLREAFALTDRQLGYTQTVLQVVLSLATIPVALLADRVSRTRIICAGVLIWSFATFLSGLAGSFATLLIARALVGIGEASYAPAAQSMISGAFSEAARARAQSVFAAGMLLGGAAGQAIGGIVGDKHGWEPAFFVVGVPGLILGLIVLRIEEPPRGPRSEIVPLGHLLRVPALWAMTLCGILTTFASLALVTWGPDFAFQRGFSLKEAGVLLGVAGFVSLIGGVVAGGTIADLLQKRFAFGRIVTIMGGLFLGTPFVVAALYAESKMGVLAGFFIAGFFLSWYHGPVTAVLHDMTPPRAHATTVGVYMFVTQLLGGSLGPLVVGEVSDRRDLIAGLQVAVAAMVLGALCFLAVIYFIRRDGLRHPALDPYHDAVPAHPTGHAHEPGPAAKPPAVKSTGHGGE